MTRTEYIAIIRNALFVSVKSSILDFVKLKVKFLLWPIINPAFLFILDKLLNFILDETELRAAYIYTDFRTTQQGKDFLLLAVAYQEGRASEKELIDSFRGLVKLSV